ncbi:MAG: YbaB/EbfC family nucleoid-associated protein [Dehalococcoidia bacterium]|nr:YbaB/EbfC family nucleoid-associated protein [Dehalococcoidia bacterium]
MNNKAMLRQAQQLQAKLMKAQNELADATIEASSGGGAVTVTMNGKQQVLSIKISPDAVDPDDIELLEDLILAAINEAFNKTQDMAQQRLGSLTGGLNIPGLT